MSRTVKILIGIVTLSMILNFALAGFVATRYVQDHVFDRFAALTPGGQYQHHSVPGIGCQGHGAAGGDCFVVGMGVKENSGGHRARLVPSS